jgi:hypothetical protein
LIGAIVFLVPGLFRRRPLGRGARERQPRGGPAAAGSRFPDRDELRVRLAL